jgi:cardiolipin synthase
MHTLLRILLGVAFEPSFANSIVLAADMVALATIPSILLSRHGRPLGALSWLLAVLTLPVAGILAWWMFGRTHLQRKTRLRRAASDRICNACPVPVSEAKNLPAKYRFYFPFAVTGRRWTEGVFPPAAGGKVELFTKGHEAFSAMEEAISTASHEVRALFYIWKTDETGKRMVQKLIERRSAGVKIRILVDSFGSRQFLREFAPKLRSSGVEVESFLDRIWKPTWNFRNHRKLLLVDGRVAFWGGMNIGREYEFDWRDSMIGVEGAVIRNLDEVFREDWAFATDRILELLDRSPSFSHIGEDDESTFCVVASGPDRTENRIHDGFFLAINKARERVWISSPYFVPGSPLLVALRTAAQRGIDVRILTARRSKWDPLGLAARSAYSHLIAEGVRIFEYLPCFLHAKSLLVDQDMAFVGSANSDSRSYRLNFELGSFILSRSLNASMNQAMEDDFAQSHEIKAADLRDTSRTTRAFESLAQLLSPLI